MTTCINKHIMCVPVCMFVSVSLCVYACACMTVCNYHVCIFLHRITTGSYTGRGIFNDLDRVPFNFDSTDIYVSQI